MRYSPGAGDDDVGLGDDGVGEAEGRRPRRRRHRRRRVAHERLRLDARSCRSIPCCRRSVAVTVAVCGGSVSRLSAIICLRLPVDQRHRRRHDVAPARRQRDRAVEAVGRRAVLIERLHRQSRTARARRRCRWPAASLPSVNEQAAWSSDFDAQAARAVLPRRARAVGRRAAIRARRRRRAVAADATASERERCTRHEIGARIRSAPRARSRRPSATATAPWSASAPPCRSCCRAGTARWRRPRTAPPRRS